MAPLQVLSALCCAWGNHPLSWASRLFASRHTVSFDRDTSSATFGLGDNDLVINLLDEAGVALVAIQVLPGVTASKRNSRRCTRLCLRNEVNAALVTTPK